MIGVMKLTTFETASHYAFLVCTSFLSEILTLLKLSCASAHKLFFSLFLCEHAIFCSLQLHQIGQVKVNRSKG